MRSSHATPAKNQTEAGRVEKMMVYVLIILLGLLAILGAPLFSVILAVAMLGFFISGVDLSVIAIEIYRIADTPLLLALPLFTFAGYLMGQSQTSQRLVRLTRVFRWSGT